MADKKLTEDFLSSISKISRDFERVNRELEEEREKNEFILGYLGECIFLMDAEHKILQGYSKNLEIIFNREDLSDKNFLSLLDNKVPENIIESTREYLEYMFNPEMEEDTIN